MFDALGLPAVYLLGAFGMGGGGRDGLRTGVHHQDEHDEESEEDEDSLDPGESALGRLLRHDARVACGDRVDNARGPEHSRGAVLSWISDNRVWLVPWVSALIVVGIEVGAALFAAKPIPVEGHAALGAFWVFAVGRGQQRRRALHERASRLELYARRRGIPLEVARDEWHVFQATVARVALPGGKDTP